MSGDRFQKLLGAADEAARAELKLAHNGRIEAMRVYQSRPGKAAKDDLDAARAFYEETIERLTGKYFPDDAPAPAGERFASRKQALDWITAQGYKVSRGKFYGDCAAGFPAVHRDKTVSRFQVLQYAQQLDVERRASDPVEAFDTARNEARKIKADADKAEMQADAMRREMDRTWILRERAEEETCVWVSRLRDAVAYHIGKNLLAMIHSCGGQPGRLSELQVIVDDALAVAGNEIANAEETTVTIEDSEDEAC